MISFIKGLLSSDEIIKDISSGLDKTFLTDQERTVHFLKYLELTMPMNRARRFIAVSVAINWMLYLWLVAGLIMFDGPKLEEIVSFGNVYIMPVMTLVTGFYFWKRQTK